MNKIGFSDRIYFSDIGLFFIAFVLGTGFAKLEIVVCTFVIFLFGTIYLRNIEAKKHDYWIFIGIGLLASFLLLYWACYIPYRPSLYRLEANYFALVLFWSIIALFLPLPTRSASSCISLVWYLSLGAFIYSFATVVASLLLLSPPYYSNIIDLRSLVRGVVATGNSPGISNLLCFLPIVFSACFLLDRGSRPIWVIWIGFMLSLLAIFCAIQLQQRTFFLLVLILQPIIIGVLLIILKRYRIGFKIFLICLVYPGLVFLEQIFGIYVLPRKLDTNLLGDPRIDMFNFWLSHVLLDPFGRVEVGPSPWDSLFWFHNFFADIHRLSGLLPMLVVAVFIVFFFVRAFLLLLRRPEWGAFVLAVSLPTFAIMNTSVVPEGERQPYLIIVLLYSITERLLWKIKER